MKDVADADNRSKQIINLRKAIVTQVEASISAQPLLKDEVSEEDKRLLAKKLNPDLTYEELVGLKCQSYVFAQTSIRCMRVISKELGDARENDWFAMYCDLYSQFVDHIYKSMVAQEKEIVYVLEPLFGPLKQWVEETKKKLLEGYNWDYDKEKIQDERRIEEEKEAKRKAKEPSKQKTISNHQIDELSEYLMERYDRLKHGELYRIEGYSPTNPFGVLQIDTGIMLIALSEFVEDKDTAVDGLRKVICKAFSKLGVDESYSREEISLNEQLSVLEIKGEKKEGGWLAEVCGLATYLMYNLNPKEFNEDEQRELARASAGNIDDAWEVYATTKNVFGYKYEISSIFGNDKSG
jgi:hypothetical protein